MNTSTRYQVHISRDGQLHINNEPQVVPDGVDPSQVVVQVLHIEAAGSGLPELVQVQDERTNSHFDMQVMPDGTTQAAGTPPAGRPPVAAEQKATHFDRLAAAQAAGRAHDFDTAIAAADDILQQLTAEQGDTATGTLEAAQFRADLAYLSGQYAFATASWTWLALAWFDRLGPGKRLTQVAAQNAAQAWMQLPPHEAGPLASDLVSMLLEVAAPERTAPMRAQITERLGQISN
ncbi:hypothetical protein AR457_37995 [Streptomyces agglomeratus]|uniref:hypothetical protein n=1 Tax=Streptomyces agglomeratus TaxID=285458 RepID=UPI0008527FF5|nr:hypothetical protein [Streptomyces agglomeratus]OEJ22997.1 hypothetical protein AR457_37995 [Streptomyces agglomeratus]OEJ36866.1 hypothetical protein BGK70_00360 [Streptomyces agglomeratus]